MKVLVALDGSMDWKRAVEQLRRIARAGEDLEVVLYHVLELRSSGEHNNNTAREIPVRDLGEQAGSWLAEQRSHIEREILDPVREGVEGVGSDGSIDVRPSISVQMDADVAARIVEKARRDGYGAVILGRWKGPGGSGPSVVTGRVVQELDDCVIRILD